MPHQRPDTCQNPIDTPLNPKILLAPRGASAHVRDHNLAGLQFRYEDLRHAGVERVAIDRTVEHDRRHHPRRPQPRRLA